MIRIKKINDHVVTAIPKLGGEDKRTVLGAEIIPLAYCNIFLSARKMSGKTSALFKILKECTGKKTKVIAFVATLYNDDNWIFIQKWMKDKGIDFEGHTSLKEDGVDLLTELVKRLEEEAEDKLAAEDEELDEEAAKRGGFIKAFADANLPKEKKEKKPKYIAPEIIIVLDDLSNELKSKSLVTLLKRHRHYKSKTIISSQYYLDLLPESREQIDYFILFKGQTEKKMETIYKDAQLAIPYDLFVKLYHNATSKPYGFLFVDKRTDEFRQGFNKVYELPEQAKQE